MEAKNTPQTKKTISDKGLGAAHLPPSPPFCFSGGCIYSNQVLRQEPGPTQRGDMTWAWSNCAGKRLALPSSVCRVLGRMGPSSKSGEGESQGVAIGDELE